AQADISTVVAYSFTKKVRPHLDLAGECPALTAFVERCEALDAFSSAPVPG
ncbi:MAG: glutathione S-transferase, partial [Rhodospirillaceae bacterium]|nr:glutathione S-transferase [Rhodospirillaceae bacterium]